MLNFILLIISVILGAAGQFFLRLGMKSYGQVSVVDACKHLFSIILTPSILLGFSAFGISSIIWLSVISKNQLSYAYPMVSLGYILTLFLSRFFLNEQISIMRAVGTALIISGVFFISRS